MDYERKKTRPKRATGKIESWHTFSFSSNPPTAFFSSIPSRTARTAQCASHNKHPCPLLQPKNRPGFIRVRVLKKFSAFDSPSRSMYGRPPGFEGSGR
jgi:hypothetical protein